MEAYGIVIRSEVILLVNLSPSSNCMVTIPLLERSTVKESVYSTDIATHELMLGYWVVYRKVNMHTCFTNCSVGVLMMSSQILILPLLRKACRSSLPMCGES